MTESTPLSGLVLESLPDGWAPIGVIALIKCRDAEGNSTWAFRTTHDLGDEEVLGALLVRSELTKAWLIDAYTPDED